MRDDVGEPDEVLEMDGDVEDESVADGDLLNVDESVEVTDIVMEGEVVGVADTVRVARGEGEGQADTDVVEEPVALGDDELEPDGEGEPLEDRELE